MPETKMREVLDDVLFQDASGEINTLSVPGSTHVRVVIETLNEAFQETDNDAHRIDYQFLHDVKGLPEAEDLPKDLAHQHDHYVYGLPKKA